MSIARPVLLVSRILQCRDVSPLLVLTDTMFQSAAPLLRYHGECARAAGIKVISIHWRRGSDVCTMTLEECPRMKELDSVLHELRALIPTSGKVVLIISDLNDFLALQASHLSVFLSTLIQLAPGRISVCASFHKDIPCPSYPTHLPSPETLLQYLATTIIHVQPLTHELLSRDAHRKSKTSTVVLDLEGRDIFLPLGVNCDDLFLQLEHRRKSGRGVRESSVFHTKSSTFVTTDQVPGLEDELDRPVNAQIPQEEELGFKIELTEKQKADRDGVVLPHYVQIEDGFGGTTTERKDGAAQVGGNIYYEPDSGDDFDMEDPDDDLML